MAFIQVACNCVYNKTPSRLVVSNTELYLDRERWNPTYQSAKLCEALLKLFFRRTELTPSSYKLMHISSR